MADSKANPNKDYGFATRAIHAGQEYDQWSNREIVPPIVTSMTYYQNDPAKMEVSDSSLFVCVVGKFLTFFFIDLVFFSLMISIILIRNSNGFSFNLRVIFTAA